MHHLLAPITFHIKLFVEHGGYIALFVVNVLEGIPIIGQFVPGHTLVILSGFLAKLHVFNPFILVPLVIVAAFIGDSIAYFCGRKFGFLFLSRFGKFFFIKDEYIEKAKRLVNEHRKKTIILGRFSPITRPLAPFVVGASEVPFNKFWFLDLVGVVLWSVSSLAVGYIFGAGYHAVAGIFGKYIVIAIIIALLIVLAYRFINKQFHIFAKYELITLGLNLVGLYVFFKTIQDALSDHAFMEELDVWINLFFSQHATAHWLTFMNIVTDAISPLSISVVGFIGIIYLLYRKYWRYAIIAITSLGGGLFLNAFIKDIVMRERPMDAFIIETGYSFPSGHAVAATIFFTLLVYFCARKIKSIVWRELFVVASVGLVLLTAFSRIYLGVHWLSDVVAGIGFGLFWTTLMILLVRYVGILYVKYKESRRG